MYDPVCDPPSVLGIDVGKPTVSLTPGILRWGLGTLTTETFTLNKTQNFFPVLDPSSSLKSLRPLRHTEVHTSILPRTVYPPVSHPTGLPSSYSYASPFLPPLSDPRKGMTPEPPPPPAPYTYFLYGTQVTPRPPMSPILLHRWDV